MFWALQNHGLAQSAAILTKSVTWMCLAGVAAMCIMPGGRLFLLILGKEWTKMAVHCIKSPNLKQKQVCYSNIDGTAVQENVFSRLLHSQASLCHRLGYSFWSSRNPGA